MKKNKLRKAILIIVISAVLILGGVCFLMQRQTYDRIETVEYYENISLSNADYAQYLDGVIKFTRDGISYLDKTGEERWNQSCQMSNPIMEVRGRTAVVCDRGGTSILVFEKDGLKGEITTVRPIEKVSVSEQGIVAVILKDDKNPMIACYDATGNTLVEQSTALDNTGYPVDIALSKDGNTLLASYLLVKDNGISTRIVYYDFSGEEIDKKSYIISENEYEGVVIPVVDFLDKDTSVLVADDSILLYEGKEEPAEATRFELDIICNVAYNEKMIAVIVKDSQTSEYKLQLYNLNGELLSDIPLSREFNHIKICNDQIILFEGNVCGIYTKDGICKFDGTIDEEILEMFVLTGINKYMMINANGFYKIRLVK